MKGDEVKHIQKNLDKLIETTTVSPDILAKLQARGIFGRCDVEALTSPQTLPSAKALQFYEILTTRVDAYGVLLECLEETKQSGACAILKAIRLDCNDEPKFVKAPESVKNFYCSKAPAWKVWKLNRREIMILCSDDAHISAQKVMDSMKISINKITESCLETGKSPVGDMTVVICETKVEKILPKLDYIRGKIIILTEEDPSNLEAFKKGGIHVEKDIILWTDLSSSFQCEIAEKEVIFQTQKIPLKEVSALAADDERRNLLVKYLNGKPLIDLINGQTPTFFKNMLSNQLPYYVPRKIRSRAVLSSKLFSKPSNDILVISSIERHELSTFVLGMTTDTSANQIKLGHLTTRFILLQFKGDFEKICQMNRKPVHWLSYDKNKGTFTWIKSKGNISFIQSLVHETQEQFAEEDFLDSLLSSSLIDRESTPVCISDTPGMGKSILLENLGRRLMGTYPEKLILFVVISEFVRHLKTYVADGILVPLAILDLLSKYACPSQYPAEVFKSGVLSGNIKVELMFDGLDEVHQSDLSLANQCLEMVVETLKSIRVYVTTRPHLLFQLETTLEVLGYSIDEFSESDQIRFLTKYWSQGRILDNDRLLGFATNCLIILKEKITPKDKDVAGIPLQCLLIAEVYEEDAIRYADPENLINFSEDALPPLPVISSVTDLYHKVFWKKMKNYAALYANGEVDENLLLHMHSYDAIKLIYPQWWDKIPLPLKGSHFPQEEMLKVGILEKSSLDDVPRFIHRTFAEYLVAWILREMLTKDMWWEEIHSKFLWDSILCTNETTLEFRNARFRPFQLPARTFNSYVVVYFVDSLVKNVPKCDAMQSYLEAGNVSRNKLQDIVVACVFEDFFHTFQYILSFGKVDKKIFEENMLYLATCRGSAPILNQIADYFRQGKGSLGKINIPEVRLKWAKTNANVLDVKAYSLLHFAVQRGDYSIVEALVNSHGFREIIQDAEDLLPLLLHVCLEDSLIQTLSVVQAKIQILRLIVNINDYFIEEKNEEKETLIVCEKMHIKVLLELITLKANVFSRNESGDTVVHLVSRSCTDFEIYQLVSAIPEKSLKKILKVTGEWERTPLHALIYNAFAYDDKFSGILDQFAKFNADFNSIDKEGDSVLGTAIKKNRRVACLQALIKHGANWERVSLSGKSAVHVAANIGHLDALKLFTSLEFNVNNKDSFGNCPLHDALAENYCFIGYSDRDTKATFEILIEAGADVNAVNDNQEGVLHIAAKHGDTKVLKHIIENFELDVNQKDGNERTPMFHGVQSMHKHVLKTLRFLVGKNANVNVKNNNGQSLLHVATVTGSLATVKFLLHNKYGDVNAMDEKKNTPLHFAILNDGDDQLEIVTCLLEYGGDINATNENSETPLHSAISKGNVKMIKHLIIAGSNVNTVDIEGNTVLHHVLLNVRNEKSVQPIVTLLVNQGANVNAMNNSSLTPLTLAYANNRKNLALDTIHFLMERGAICNSEISTEILEQVVFGVKKVITKQKTITFAEKLVEQGAKLESTDDNGNSYLHVAAQRGWHTFAKLLIEKGLNVNCTNSVENTTLHEALLNYHDSQNGTVELLLKYDADVNALNKAKLSPLHNALLHDDCFLQMKTLQFLLQKDALPTTELATLCLNYIVTQPDSSNDDLEDYDILKLASACVDQGADLTYKDEANCGYTMLHSSCSFGSKIGVQFLLERGVDVNCRDSRGNSPLHHVLFQDDNLIELISLLVKHGVDVNAKNSNGLTALGYILEIFENDGDHIDGIIQVLELLIRGGALSSKRTATLALKQIVVNSGNSDEEVCIHLIQSCFSCGVDVGFRDASGNTIMHSGAKYGSVTVIQQLIKAGVPLNEKNKEGDLPLYLGMTREDNQQTEVTKFLVKSMQCIPDSDFSVMFSKALESQPCLLKLDTVQFLHSFGVVNSGNIATLVLKHVLCVESQMKEVEYKTLANSLVECGGDIYHLDGRENTVFHLVVQSGSLSGVKYLLDRKFDINGRNLDGDTPLHCALTKNSRNQQEVVQFLVENQASLNTFNNECRTPLLNVLLGNPENLKLNTLQFLEQAGAIYSEEIATLSLKHVIAESDNLIEPVEYAQLANSLLDHGADLNYRDGIGNTLLHWATYKRCLRGVEFLIGRNVNTDVVNLLRKNALSHMDCYIPHGDVNYAAVHYLNMCSTDSSWRRNCDAILTLLTNCEQLDVIEV